MEWKCPHCEVSLSVSDERLPDDWFFSKCSHCSGYAVIRKAAVRAVDVNPQSKDIQENSETLIPNFPSHLPELPPFQSTQPSHTPTPLLEKSIQNKFNEMQSFAREKLIQPTRRVRLSHLAQLAVVGCGVIALSSGIHFYQQADKLASQLEEIKSQSQVHNEIRDEIRHQAMAPERAPQRVARQVESPTPEVAVNHGSGNYIAADDLIPKARTVASARSLEPKIPLRVRTPHTRALLRQGPGRHFEIVGIADPSVVYNVRGFKENWFRIQDPESRKIAWIRNDLVHSENQNH